MSTVKKEKGKETWCYAHHGAGKNKEKIYDHGGFVSSAAALAASEKSAIQCKQGEDAKKCDSCKVSAHMTAYGLHA